MGFWHNWFENGPNGSGYRQGFFGNLSLADIPLQYNVVAVAFMKVLDPQSDHIPSFKPHKGTDAEFLAQVNTLKSQGRNVLISLGGADAQIELHDGDEQPLADRIIELANRYGFEGLDIDLEQTAISAGKNSAVIPKALLIVKNHFEAEGRYFIISMAPEFPHLRLGGSYAPYITALEEEYDFIAPQYYNQGGDGVYVEGLGWVSQDNDSLKEEFLYHLTKSIVSEDGREFVHIPPEKFVIGIPTNNDAAATGYVIDPNDVKNALKRLEDSGLPIKGVMTWSVNWDAGRTKDGVEYDWEFVKRYGYLADSEIPQPEKPGVPQDLTSTNQTERSIWLTWTSSQSGHPITRYNLYRDGVGIGNGRQPPYFDSGLDPNTEYAYQVSAIDDQGQSSDLSPVLRVRTLPGEIVHPAWIAGSWYPDDAQVRYLEMSYVCVMQHTSEPSWTPDLATTLWMRM
ncbi:chitinase [Mesorhizobium sp. NBSH29]|nr:chitinase [Mesorhizobium sp. NBSH29]